MGRREPWRRRLAIKLGIGHATPATAMFLGPIGKSTEDISMNKFWSGVVMMVVCWTTSPAFADDEAVQAELKKLKEGDDKAAVALAKLGAKAAPGLVKFVEEAKVSDAGTAWAAST